MRIAVLGGSGFLGSHVADALSDAGHSVVLFDLVASPWRRQDQEMIIGNVLDEAALDRCIKGCDAVFNLAGVVDLDQADTSPFESARVNILGNINVCDACVRYGVKRYVFASTLYVYSRAGGAYRCSKQACETYIDYYHLTRGLEYTILRYGSLFGPRSGLTNGIHRFICEALTSRRIRYVGNPEAIREYIHVSDAAKASVEALGPQYAGRHVTVSGNQSIRVVDLFAMISEIIGRKIECDYVADPMSPHYVTTPYSFSPTVGLKYTPQFHVDLGQGLLMKIEEVSRESFQKL